MLGATYRQLTTVDIPVYNTPKYSVLVVIGSVLAGYFATILLKLKTSNSGVTS